MKKIAGLNRTLPTEMNSFDPSRLDARMRIPASCYAWMRRGMLTAALLLLAAGGGHSQNSNPPVLPEVLVTGTAGSGPSLTSPDAESAAQAVNHLPAAANVVTSRSFQLGRGAYLEDFLGYQPGLFIQSEQGTEDTKVSIRGSGIQSDNIAGIGVVLDGMALNQADGEAFLQDLDLRVVKYATVYRGADALRFGGVTLGGAINLVTATGRDMAPLQLWDTAGSYGFFEEGLVTGWSHGATDVLLSFSNHQVDGFREHSQEDSQKLFVSFGAKISDQAENRLYFFWGNLSQNNPNSLSKEEMYANPRQTDPQSIAQDWDTKWDYFRFADRFVFRGDDWQVQLGAYYNHRDQLQRQEFDDGTPLGLLRFYSDDFGADVTYESTAELFGQRNRFTVGFLPTFEAEADTFYVNNSGNAGAELSGDRTFSSNLVLYTENQHYFTGRFSILTGCQFVYVGRKYLDRLKVSADGDQSGHENYWGVNPKLGASYEWNKDCLSYVNFSRSFQPPSFDESLALGSDGDELFNRLDAQTAVTLEAGTRGKLGPFSWDLALYHSWVRDELLDLTNGRGVAIGTVNVPRSSHQGIEAELEAEIARGLLAKPANGSPGDRIGLKQTYTLNDFHFTDNSIYGNNRIAGIPAQFYKAELLYEHPSGFYAGPNVEWSIVKYPVDEANSLFADPYALLGFRMGYKTAKGFNIFFEAKNLTNEIYAATVAPVGDARTEGNDSFNPGNGRAFYGGISWTW